MALQRSVRSVGLHLPSPCRRRTWIAGSRLEQNRLQECGGRSRVIVPLSSIRSETRTEDRRRHCLHMATAGVSRSHGHLGRGLGGVVVPWPGTLPPLHPGGQTEMLDQSLLRRCDELVADLPAGACQTPRQVADILHQAPTARDLDGAGRADVIEDRAERVGLEGRGPGPPPEHQAGRLPPAGGRRPASRRG